MQEYGFAKEEINYIMRYKPAFILFEADKGEGLLAMNRLLIGKKGFKMELVKTLIVRYPYILSKTEKELEEFFEIFAKYGLTDA